MKKNQADSTVVSNNRQTLTNRRNSSLTVTPASNNTSNVRKNTTITVPTRTYKSSNNNRRSSVNSALNTAPSINDIRISRFDDIIKPDGTIVSGELAKGVPIANSISVDRLSSDNFIKPETVTLRDTPSKSLTNPTKRNRLGMITKGADWIGLGADLLGSLGSAIINYNASNNEQAPYSPVLATPGKLVTNYNIAPRLANLENSKANMLRDTDEGISSAGRLDRRNVINNTIAQQINSLWGEKTNQEVGLLNQDTLNQQQVNSQNVGILNDYYNRFTDYNNRRRLGRTQSYLIGLSGLSDAVGNFIDQGKQRYADKQAMNYYKALLTNEGRKWFDRNID